MTIDKFINPEPLQQILKDRGNYGIRRSERFKELIKFDEYWEHLFNLFYEKPFLRLILQYFISESRKEGVPDRFFDINTILADFRNNLKNIENTVPDSPLSVEVCPKCNSNDFLKKDRLGKQFYHCKKCHQQFEMPEKKHTLFELGTFDIHAFLMELVNTGILMKVYQLTCYCCGSINISISEKELMKDIHCNKCNAIKELLNIFTLVEPTKEIKNFESIWLEWYALKIICENCGNLESILPTYYVKGTNFETEIDLIVLTKSKKVISIDCKAKTFKSSLSRNDVDNNVLTWKKFSDYVLIVTTTEISGDCKNFWGSQLDNIVFVDGKNLEELNEIISNL